MLKIRPFVTKYPVLAFTILTLTYQLLIVGFMAFRLRDGLRMHDDPISHMVFRFRVFGPLGFAILVSFYVERWAGLRTLFGSYLKWRVPLPYYGFALVWKFMYFYIGMAVVVFLGLNEWAGWVVDNFFAGTHEKAMNLLRNMGFIVGIAFVEETAWMKFSVTRLQARYSAFTSCILVGLSWGAWYLPMLLLGEGVPDGFPPAVFMVSMVALTFMLGWLFNMTRSGLVLMFAQIVSNCAFFIVPTFTGEDLTNRSNFNAFVVVNCVVSALLVLIYGWKELGVGPRAVWGEERTAAGAGPVRA